MGVGGCPPTLTINLQLSLKVIDRGLHTIEQTGYDLTTLRLGALMREAGYEVVGAVAVGNFSGALPWFGSTPEVEHRLKDLTERRTRAQTALDGLLIADELLEAIEAELKKRRDAFNALVVKVSSDGSHLVAYKDRAAVANNRPYDAAEMTPTEREAFEAQDAAYRATQRRVVEVVG